MYNSQPTSQQWVKETWDLISYFYFSLFFPLHLHDTTLHQQKVQLIKPHHLQHANAGEEFLKWVDEVRLWWRIWWIPKFLRLQLCKCRILHSSLTKWLLCAQSQAITYLVSFTCLTLNICLRACDLNLQHDLPKAINVYLFPLTGPDSPV